MKRPKTIATLFNYKTVLLDAIFIYLENKYYSVKREKEELLKKTSLKKLIYEKYCKTLKFYVAKCNKCDEH